MTPESQRIAIAEACGLTGYLHSLPDYLSDINAMNEAEKMLTDAQYIYFAAELNACWFHDNPQTDKRVGILRSASATAAQRAEAFLRTLNLWTE